MVTAGQYKNIVTGIFPKLGYTPQEILVAVQLYQYPSTFFRVVDVIRIKAFKGFRVF